MSSRRSKLRGRFEKASLPDSVFVVMNALIMAADPDTCITWMSQREMRRHCNGKSSRWVDDCVAHLERHHWVVRSVFGRGRAARTRYELFTGEPCDCHPGPAASGKAMTGAERIAAWRERQTNVNDPANSVTECPVNSVTTAGQSPVENPLNAPANPVTTAGQRPDLAVSTGTTWYPTGCPGEAGSKDQPADRPVGQNHGHKPYCDQRHDRFGPRRTPCNRKLWPSGAGPLPQPAGLAGEDSGRRVRDGESRASSG